MKNKITLIYLLLLFFTSLLIVHPIFDRGFLVSKDNPFQLAKLYFFIEELVPKGKIFGWSNLDGAGIPNLMYEYPLYAWFVSLLHYILGISVELGYKILIFLTYSLPSILIFLFLKRYGIRESFFLAFLYLFQFDFLSFTLHGLLQFFSFIFLIAYMFFWRNFTDLKFSYKNLAILSSLSALIFLSHIYTAMFLAIFSIVALFVNIVKDKKLDFFYTLLPLFLGFLIISVVIYPSLQTSYVLEPKGGPAANTIFTAILKTATYLFFPHLRIPEIKEALEWSSTYSFLDLIRNFNNLVNLILLNIAEFFILILFLLGTIFYLRNNISNKFLTTCFISLIIVTLVGIGIVFITPLKDFFLFSSIQSARFLFYSRIIMFIFAFNGILFLKKIFYSKRFYNLREFLSQYSNVILIILAIIILYSFNNSYTKGFLLMDTSENVASFKDVKTLWNWISENVNGSETRIMFQDTYGNYPDSVLSNSHILSLTYHFTKVPSMGVEAGIQPFIDFMYVTQHKYFFTDIVHEITDLKISENLKLLNAKYIVSSENILKSKLENSQLFLKNVEFGNFTVFSLIDYKPSWLLENQNYTAGLIKFENEGIYYKIKVSEPTKILLKVSYHPYWKAFLNNTEIPLKKSKLRLSEVSVDRGEYILSFIYKPPLSIY